MAAGQCIAWLEYFFKNIGDFQPTSHAIHLPSCFSKIDIYKKLLEENTAFNHPTVCVAVLQNLGETLRPFPKVIVHVVISLNIMARHSRQKYFAINMILFCKSTTYFDENKPYLKF